MPDPIHPAPPVDATTALVMASVASLSLESARVPVAAVVASVRLADPSTPEDAVLDALAGLVAGGWLSEWDDPEGGTGVILSPWWAARLGLRLVADSSRWVLAETYREARRRKGGTGTISEVDLDDESDVPLDQLSEEDAARRVRLVGPGPFAPDDADPDGVEAIIRAGGGRVVRGISDRDWLEVYADAIGYHDWSQGEDLPRGAVVLMGVPPWPLPGQSRAPAGPDAVPEESEAAKAKAAQGTGRCHACKGLPLRNEATCDACSRGSRDHRIGADLRAKIAASYRRAADPGPAKDVPEETGKGRRKGGASRRERGKVYTGGGGLRGGIGG